MQAVRVHRFGDIGLLVVDDVAPPSVDPDQVVINVEASGVNFADILVIGGKYQIRPDLDASSLPRSRRCRCTTRWRFYRGSRKGR